MKSNGGFSLTEVLVGIIILGTLTFLISKVVSFSGFFWKLDRRTQGDQVLALTGASLQMKDYDSLIAQCTAKSAFSGPITGACLSGNQLNPSAVASGPVTPDVLEVQRDWNGDAANPGTVCIELTQCFLMAQGRALQVTLTGYWPEAQANSANVFQRRTLAFRRTRW